MFKDFIISIYFYYYYIIFYIIFTGGTYVSTWCCQSIESGYAICREIANLTASATATRYAILWIYSVKN